MIPIIQPSTPFGLPWKAINYDNEFNIPCIETLLREDSNLQLEPWLATDWETAADLSSITLTLRQGVKFHDGTDFDAEAVKYCLDKNMEAKIVGTNTWSSIDAIDDYTVKINLSTWQNGILAGLAGAAGEIVSPTAVGKNGEDWAGQNPVGTGPFVFDHFSHDQELVYTRFDGYWQEGLPYLDEIDYLFINDPMAQEAAYKAGQVDTLEANNAKILSDLVAAGGDLIFNADGAITAYPDMANADSPLSNLLVRQACDYAIDREAIAKAQGFGIFPAAYQLPRAGTPGYDSSLKREYDPAKARELLEQADYTDGFDLTIYAETPFKDLGLAVKGYFDDIGIRCAFEEMTAAGYADHVVTGWHSGFMVAPTASYQNFLKSIESYWYTSNFYISLKKPADLDTLYNEAVSTPELDPTKIAALEQAIFNDDSVIPVIYLGMGHILDKDKFHDSGFFTKSLYFMWTPEVAWLSE
jgi:peptide/nickel transport system substrate-binding protein